MAQATVFTNNKNQAVRIPKAMEFPDGVKKVNIIAVGNARLIAPTENAWDTWFEGEGVSADFMSARDQPEEQEREAF